MGKGNRPGARSSTRTAARCTGWRSSRSSCSGIPPPYGKEASSTTPTPPAAKPPEIVKLLLGIHQVKFEGACRVNFNKAGKYFSKTSACTPAQVTQAEDAIQRFFREQGL